MKKYTGVLTILVGLFVVAMDTQAFARGFRGGGGGFRGGGGMRVSASTGFRGGAGYSRTVVAGRYHRPATLPAYRPGLSYPGHAIRTTRRVARRTAYRTAAGYSYYYGAGAYSLPSSGCYQTYWEGMTAYNCNGMMYVYDNGQYYSIQGG